MEDLANELEHLGLSEKEAAVYLSSLSLGFASVQDIAEKAVVNRATTYTTVEALERHGLMKSKMEEGKRLYVSESPERFRALLCLQRKELEEKEREFLRLLPHVLMHAHPRGARPSVKWFDGEAGQRTMMEMLRSVSGPCLLVRGSSSEPPSSSPVIANPSIGTGEAISPIRNIIIPGLGLKTILIRDYFVAICLEDETHLSLLFASKDLADAMRMILG